MPNSSPLLSVIIPVYNVENYLDECILSVLNQTYRNLEIILIDDGSTDSSSIICDYYATQDHRVRVIHKQNQGLGITRNCGIDVATGEYITFIDSDDCIDIDTYSLLMPQMEKWQLDCMRFGITFFSKEKPIIKQKERSGGIVVTSNKKKIKAMAAMLFEQYPLPQEKTLKFEGSVCSGIYKMDVIKRNSLHFHSEREYMSEDYLFMYELLQCVSNIGFSNDQFYNYRFVQNSLSKALKVDRAIRANSYCSYIEKRMKADGYSFSEIKHLMGYFTGNLIDSYINICHLKLSLSEKRKMINKILKMDYCQEVLLSYDAYHRLKSWNLFFFFTLKYHIWELYLSYKHIK